MGEREKKSEISKVELDIGFTIRVDWETREELKRIALFEKDKLAPMCRRILVEKVQVYERNPAYKRFLKRLEDLEAKKRIDKK